MFRDVVERFVTLDERLLARRHLDRLDVCRVHAGLVKVSIDGSEVRERLDVSDVRDARKEDGKFVVSGLARLREDFLPIENDQG